MQARPNALTRFTSSKLPSYTLAPYAGEFQEGHRYGYHQVSQSEADPRVVTLVNTGYVAVQGAVDLPNYHSGELSDITTETFTVPADTFAQDFVAI